MNRYIERSKKLSIHAKGENDMMKSQENNNISGLTDEKLVVDKQAQKMFRFKLESYINLNIGRHHGCKV